MQRLEGRDGARKHERPWRLSVQGNYSRKRRNDVGSATKILMERSKVTKRGSRSEQKVYERYTEIGVALPNGLEVDGQQRGQRSKLRVKGLGSATPF